MNPNDPTNPNPSTNEDLSTPAAPAAQPTQPVPPLAPNQTVTPSFLQPAPAAAPAPNGGSHKTRNILLVILIVLLLAGGGVGAYLLTNKDTSDNQQASKPADSQQENAPKTPEETGEALAGQQARAKDTKRTTDIKAMHAQLEAYYAQYAHYPSLAQMNDAAWRKTNLKGLDEGALQDPDGTSAVLAATPAPKVYAYAATSNDGKACNNGTSNGAVDCVIYKLTATLSDGSTYVKENLN